MAGRYSASPPNSRVDANMSSVGRMTTNFEVGSQDNVLYGVGIDFEVAEVSGGQVSKMPE
jgi:hypothetical protein